MKFKGSLLVALVLSHSIAFAGGPWSKDKGEAFLFGFGRYIGGPFYANNSGEVFETSQSLSFTGLHFYGEYGLGKRWEVGGHMPLFQYANGIDDNMPMTGFSGTASGNGDLDIYLKKQLNSGSITSSIRLQLGIPIGNSMAGKEQDILLGDGEFNQMIRADIGGSLGDKMYWILFGGFNNRTNNFSDELHFGGELGYNGKKWLATLKVYSLNSLENGTAPVPNYPGIYANNLEYLAVGPTFMRKWQNSGLILDLGFAPYLRNIIAAPSISFGYYIELGKS